MSVAAPDLAACVDLSFCTRAPSALRNCVGLNNAAQFSAPGGPISLRADIDGQVLRIDIADGGMGIAREAQNRIFEMFTRVERDTDRKHAGLGIGLNIARRLVEMHGGTLVATSEGRGRGSHFCGFTTPRRASAR